jgi:hypothetical protein
LYDPDSGKGLVYYSENRKFSNSLFSDKNLKILDFRFNTLFSSMIQGQGRVFTAWECAQSIPCLEKPKNPQFSHKNPKMFDFRFNTSIPSLNQGQGSSRNRYSA